MKLAKGLLCAVLTLLTGVIPLEKAHAREVRESGTLVKTYLVSSTEGKIISPTFIPAVGSTTVDCGLTKCILRIELDTQVNGLNPPDSNVIVVLVTVDGSTQAVLPNALLGIDSTSTNGGSNVRSFAWIARGLAPGTHSVDVSFATVTGNAGSANRTLTISVYK